MGNYITALEWAKGNPIAMSFLVELNRQEEEMIRVITECLVKNYKIRGRYLGVLWLNCMQNMENVRMLCEECPADILLESSMRLDGTGEELVNQYFKS